MNISGIRPTQDFYSYNSIKINELRNQQILAAQKANKHNNAETLVEESLPVEVNEAPVYKQEFTSYDYAKTYRPEATYELKGIDSDINKLDIQKAVSDLDKDQVLKQYQFFVGTRKPSVGEDLDLAEKIFRSGENFSL